MRCPRTSFSEVLEMLNILRRAASAVAGLADLFPVAVENERRRIALYAVFLDQLFVSAFPRSESSDLSRGESMNTRM
jgi:hypothetical protein